MSEISSFKPSCKLSGTDGNVFAVIGRVSKCLAANVSRDAADEFRKRALSSSSYEAVLQLCFEYVDVE